MTTWRSAGADVATITPRPLAPELEAGERVWDRGTAVALGHHPPRAERRKHVDVQRARRADPRRSIAERIPRARPREPDRADPRAAQPARRGVLVTPRRSPIAASSRATTSCSSVQAWPPNPAVPCRDGKRRSECGATGRGTVRPDLRGGRSLSSLRRGRSPRSLAPRPAPRARRGESGPVPAGPPVAPRRGRPRPRGARTAVAPVWPCPTRRLR